MATSYWFDVMDYGATANGVTDDTTAIQSAINAVPPPAELSFPGGHLQNLLRAGDPLQPAPAGRQ
ncbi:glycosyl hydrolase family 28-related protein [Streptomyces sp. NPDC094143]|uniref:glycosyl hydrolase family 28-related protein n=1 Tax=Streptomyces sp. NPDC094143 TaxID=3155310 RepID=UPI00332FD1A3